MRGDRHLTKAAQYRLVYEKGSSWIHPLLVMKALPNGLELSRYGFSVSRRVGKAVVRNRTRRLLREISKNAPLRPGWDIVLIARLPAARSGYRDLEQAVNTLLKRAGIVTGEYEKACTGTN